MQTLITIQILTQTSMFKPNRGPFMEQKRISKNLLNNSHYSHHLMISLFRLIRTSQPIIGSMNNNMKNIKIKMTKIIKTKNQKNNSWNEAQDSISQVLRIVNLPLNQHNKLKTKIINKILTIVDMQHKNNEIKLQSVMYHKTEF